MIKPSEWEPSPLFKRVLGRERRRVSKPVYFLGFCVTYKRVWEYRK